MIVTYTAPNPFNYIQASPFLVRQMSHSYPGLMTIVLWGHCQLSSRARTRFIQLAQKAELGADRISVLPYFRLDIPRSMAPYISNIVPCFLFNRRFPLESLFKTLSVTSNMLERLKNVVVIGGSYVGLVFHLH